MVIKTGRILGFLGLLLISTVSFAQNIEVTASAARTSVDLNEPFRVTFATNSRTGNIKAPAFENFIIVNGPYSSQSTQVINGNVKVSRSISYDVVATEEGQFNMAPATMMVKGKLYESNRLKINVEAGTQRKNRLSEKAKESFDVSILTNKKSVYVGEPILMLLQATLMEPVRNLAMIQAPNFENVLQQKLDVRQETRREVINGKIATVLDFDKRLIIPNKSGTLGGQELKISGKVQVPTGRYDFFGMPLTKFVQEVATAKIPAVKIKPLPKGAPESFKGAVGDLNFVREVSRTEVEGDESITVKVRVEGSGNFNTIAVPELLKPQGFDVYDPKYDENVRYSERGIRGYKEYEYLLVPQFKGTFILPAMSWSYFDPSTEQYISIEIPEENLIVSNPALAANPGFNESEEPVQKREISTIEEDIRYLQDARWNVFLELDLRKLTWGVLLVVALAWGIQAIPRKEKEVEDTSKKRPLRREVELAFKANKEDRFGIMLNAIEEALLERGVAREDITDALLQKELGESVGSKTYALIQRCQMAQYAPSSEGDTNNIWNEFKAIWDLI